MLAKNRSVVNDRNRFPFYSMVLSLDRMCEHSIG